MIITSLIFLEIRLSSHLENGSHFNFQQEQYFCIKSDPWRLEIIYVKFHACIIRYSDENKKISSAQFLKY